MFNNLRELITTMPDEKACRDYLIQQRWSGSPVCPYCGCGKVYSIEGSKRFKCGSKTCYKKFSVTVGTIFEASNIPLTKWLMAIYICSSHKKGISSYQLGRDLGIAQKSAWFMLHRIRHAFGSGNADITLKNDVQADETYFGGSEENKHKDKRAADKKEISANKTPVVGLLETGGKVVTQVMPWVTKKGVAELIDTKLDKNAKLITDASALYYQVGKGYNHTAINHLAGEFILNGYHTNGIENYWSVLKRGIYGIYHQVSPKHLQAYCDEFSFRFNSRKMKDYERFKISMQKISGRLTYKTLVNRPKFPKIGSEIMPMMEE